MIKNLIFDLGGVIININPMAYVGEMQRMGCTDLKGMHESFLKDGIYRKFETGFIAADAFRQKIRENLPNHAPDHMIDHAWNLILDDIPESRVRLLKKLKQKYRLYLLSNTNPIHHDFYQEYIRSTFALPSLDSLFDKAYYSFRIGLYKPEKEIFEYVLLDSRLDPTETAFIDDMEENVEVARLCGLMGIHVPPGMDITGILKDF